MLLHDTGILLCTRLVKLPGMPETYPNSLSSNIFGFPRLHLMLKKKTIEESNTNNQIQPGLFEVYNTFPNKYSSKAINECNILNIHSHTYCMRLFASSLPSVSFRFPLHLCFSLSFLCCVCCWVWLTCLIITSTMLLQKTVSIANSPIHNNCTEAFIYLNLFKWY